jgi:hypothetical protein
MKVVAPGPYRAVTLQRKAVVCAPGDRHHAGQVTHRSGDIAAAGAAVAELAPTVVPQARTVRSLLSAELWSPPPAIATTPVRLLTRTGTSLSVFLPLPS